MVMTVVVVTMLVAMMMMKKKLMTRATMAVMMMVALVVLERHWRWAVGGGGSGTIPNAILPPLDWFCLEMDNEVGYFMVP